MFHLLIKIALLLTIAFTAVKLFLQMLPWLIALAASFGFLKFVQFLRNRFGPQL